MDPVALAVARARRGRRLHLVVLATPNCPPARLPRLPPGSRTRAAAVRGQRCGTTSSPPVERQPGARGGMDIRVRHIAEGRRVGHLATELAPATLPPGHA